MNPAPRPFKQQVPVIFDSRRKSSLDAYTRGGAFGKRDQFIHGPLVVGMGPVLHRFDLPRRRDQKVTRKAQWASRKSQAKMAVRHPAHAGAQGFEAHEPERGFHAKFFVEGLLRIANQHEWNILLVRPDRLSGGVKTITSLMPAASISRA